MSQGFILEPLLFLAFIHDIVEYSKTCLKRSLKKNTKIGFKGRLSLNAGQKYGRMLQGEHSAILLTFIKLPFTIKIFVLSIFEWPLKTFLNSSILHLADDTSYFTQLLTKILTFPESTCVRPLCG